MGDPVVDVVLATNRLSPYLAETLGSVRAQTWTSWRLTVVDDGSPCPDDVAAAVAEVPGARVVRQAASGLAAARNTGIAATTGDLLVFLDDDDLWAPAKLDQQVEALAADPRAVASHTGGHHIDGQGADLGHPWPARPGTARQMRRLEVDLPRITTLMVRRTALTAIGGFDTAYSTAEDIAFALDLVRHGPLAAVDEPLTSYRRHTTNMTNTIPTARQNRVHEQVWRDRIASARAAGRTDEVADLRHGLRVVRTNAARDALARARHSAAAGAAGAGAADLWWSASRAPVSVVAGALERLRRRQ